MEQLRGWMTWCDEDYSLEDSSNFILKAAEAWEQGTAYSFAIIGSQEDDFLGSVGLSHVNRAHNFANMGYWVRQSRTRSGVASAATLLAARFGLQELGLNRLELLIPTENMASQRVAQKAGAQFEAILRNRLILRGRRCDAVLYSLVQEDLQPNGFPPVVRNGHH